MRITIVEDDRIISELLTTTLTQRGHDVSICHLHSLSAIKACSPVSPDILMFDMGAFFELDTQVCHQVLAEFPACRILPMTSNVEAGAELPLPDGSTVRVLRKPFSLRALLDRIEAMGERYGERHLCDEDSEPDLAALRHSMRNTAMVIHGSADLMLECAGCPAGDDIAKKVCCTYQRGLDSKTLTLLQSHCKAALQASTSVAFQLNAERLLHACTKALDLLKERKRLLSKASHTENAACGAAA